MMIFRHGRCLDLVFPAMIKHLLEYVLLENWLPHKMFLLTSEQKSRLVPSRDCRVDGLSPETRIPEESLNFFWLVNWHVVPVQQELITRDVAVWLLLSKTSACSKYADYFVILTCFSRGCDADAITTSVDQHYLNMREQINFLSAPCGIVISV